MAARVVKEESMDIFYLTSCEVLYTLMTAVIPFLCGGLLPVGYP